MARCRPARTAPIFELPTVFVVLLFSFKPPHNFNYNTCRKSTKNDAGKTSRNKTKSIRVQNLKNKKKEEEGHNRGVVLAPDRAFDGVLVATPLHGI
jgi:hypothetical protein